MSAPALNCVSSFTRSERAVAYGTKSNARGRRRTARSRRGGNRTGTPRTRCRCRGTRSARRARTDSGSRRCRSCACPRRDSRMLMLDHGTSISTNHCSSLSRTACCHVPSQSRSNLFWFVTRPSRTPPPSADRELVADLAGRVEVDDQRDGVAGECLRVARRTRLHAPLRGGWSRMKAAASPCSVERMRTSLR